MKEQPISHINLSGHNYAITYTANEFGVCRGYGRIKYMPVVWKYPAPHYFPQLYKTRLSMMGTAEEVYNNLLTCAKLQSNLPECIAICEHVLAHGRGKR